ncbi:MAG: hypothetical protein ACOH2V_11265 [Candidatus Saccharimonadaceae bacterium]
MLCEQKFFALKTPNHEPLVANEGQCGILTWISLESVGFVASLQHYNPIIDKPVKEEWNLSEDWKLIAQMPFGMPVNEPGVKNTPSTERKIVCILLISHDY